MKKVGKTTRLFRYDLNPISFDHTAAMMNRFKGPDLMGCLKNYGQRFSHRTGDSDQNHPEEQEMHQGKVASEKASQTTEGRRGVNGKGERGRCTHVSAELQRTARRGQKASAGQSKETGENDNGEA